MNQNEAPKPAETQQPKPKREIMPVPMKAGVFAPANLVEAFELAKFIAYSGLVPKQYEENPGAVLIAVQMGAELGLSPMSAIQNIAVINGRPSLWGDALLALVLAHADCEDVAESFDDKTMTATCTVKRRGRTPTVRAFSQADATQAGLWGKSGPWQQYPKRMLQMRARGFALRDAFPDALRGINVAEEVQDIIDVKPEYVERLPDEPEVGVIQLRAKKAEPVSVEAPSAPTAAPKAETAKSAASNDADGKLGW